MFPTITQEKSSQRTLYRLTANYLVLVLLTRNCPLRKPFKQQFLPFLSVFFFVLHFVPQKLSKNLKFWNFIWNYKLTVWIQILKMQQCKLIILSNFYCIHSCCLNLFSCQICFFVCIYYSSCIYVFFFIYM